MSKDKMCYDTFENIEKIAEELERLADKVRMLKGAVQNPDFIQAEDFSCFFNNCVYVRDEVNTIFNRTCNSLKCIYEQVDCIYNGE